MPSLYYEALSAKEKHALARATGALLDDEIELLRLLIRRELLDGDGAIEKICKAIDSLAKTAATRAKLTVTPNDELAQAFRNALDELENGETET